MAISLLLNVNFILLYYIRACSVPSFGSESGSIPVSRFKGNIFRMIYFPLSSDQMNEFGLTVTEKK